MRRHPLYPSLLVALILLLGACGGSGGGNGDDDGDDDDAFEGIDETADTDGDGLVNRDDVDDDNDGLIEIKNLEMLD